MNLIYHRQEWPEHKSTYIVTEDGSGMVRVTFDKLDEVKEALISDLYVVEDRRNKGIGSQLLNAAIKEFQDLVDYHYLMVKRDINWIEKDENLKKLVEFYKHNGFIISAKYNCSFSMTYNSDHLKT